MARKPAQRNPLMPFYIILGLVAVGGVIVLLNQLRGAGGGDAALAPVPVQIDPAELSRVQGISIGRADAPVVMYEFADFQCPACGQFAAFITPLIKERLVDTGIVRYVYYDYPLSQHPHSFVAARAARCANEQGKFWEYHDLVYGRQSSWSGLGNAVDFFIDLGAEAGLEEGAFAACVRSTRFQEEVSQSLGLGESLGVAATPTLFVNGKHLQQIPGSFAELERIVLAEAGAAGAAGAAPAGAPAADTTAAAPAGT